MPPDAGDTAILRPMLRKGPSSRRLGRRGSLNGDASSSSRNLGLFSSGGSNRKLSTKSQHDDAADSMRMDAMAGLQMPTPGRDSDPAFMSTTAGPSLDRGRVPPLRSKSSDGMPSMMARSLPLRSQSSDGMPSSAMFTKRTLPRRTPSRSHSSDLQNLADLAFARQSLPDERQNPLVAMSQVVRQRSPPRQERSSHEYMSQGSRYADETQRLPTLSRRCPTSRSEFLHQGRNSQSTSVRDDPPRRRAPIRTNSTPMAPFQGDHAPRLGMRRGDVSRSSEEQPRVASSRPTPTPFSVPDPRAPENNNNDSYKPLSIEIAHGVFARLRGAQETYHAVENDLYMPTICHDCQADLCVIMDASYLLCPKCKSVSPVEGGNPDIIEGGVGLGFTLDDLRTWQAEILSGRTLGRESASSHEPRRSRRQSMW